MTPPGADDDTRSAASRYPMPPFDVDLLADLHAGVLPVDVADHVRARLDEDPDARAVLEALDRTTADLGALDVPLLPVPPAVTSRTRSTLDQISAEVTSTGQGRVTGLMSRSRRRVRWLAAGGVGAAAAIIGVVGVSVALLQPPAEQGPMIAQPATSSPDFVTSADHVKLLSVLGNTEPAPFASEAALRQCTAANGVPAVTVILGSGPIILHGENVVVILLSTGVAGRFDALVVGRDCTTGTPSLIARTVIGG
ncbi:anti-sigma factor family protein [Gordonia rhizosphera]|uniref:Anti-sigma-M factor RsmA n=1 Tax=Gordonia rhizosphera NBRC 16068 TaxID=1108045 RepID=K6X1V3_9ACTN|nr:hypothetical protein [Gordonia rhizosphera]GAB92774.1 hypothetical protein GORHZ_191_00330 [Gordonia rhizosphera NBRC 16068]